MKSSLYRIMGAAGIGSVLAFLVAGPASAATDPTLQSQTTTLTTFFSSNIGIIIGAFVTVGGLLWLCSVLFRSIGVKRASKVG